MRAIKRGIIMRYIIAGLLAASIAVPAAAQAPRAGEAAFRALYKEMVETNTTVSTGSCTALAQKIAVRLKAAGYADADIKLFNGPEDRPQDGGLVVTLPGSDPKAKAILLLSHLDVVEAKRADWERDPFTFIEEGGFFYGRGVSDDKAHGAIFTDAMIRLKQSGKPPRRTLKLALTCGEEGGPFNGAKWLVENHRDWIEAEFALNEGGGGKADANAKPISLAFQAGEKVYQDFTLETRNPGGHSSRPRPDNAIYELAAGLVRLSRTDFPVILSDTTRAYFAEMAKISNADTALAIKTLLANPADAHANEIVSRDPGWHSTLRTTCVTTMLDAGHARNALPQRAQANVNCRMFPGESVEKVRGQIAERLADASITVTPRASENPEQAAPPPPLSAMVYGPAVALASRHFAGIPIIPTMSTGATDGRYLNAAGIATYGMPGRFGMPDGNGVHGLNERISVDGLMKERDYLFDLIVAYAGK